MEKLGPDQMMFLLRLGRERGFHGAMGFITAEAGYGAPRPVDSDKQAKRLVDVIPQCTQTQTAALKQLESLAARNPSWLRPVG